MSDLSANLKAYKRGATRQTSTWYMNSLTVYLAEKGETGGQFGLMEAELIPGNEPPHVHTQEDEMYYVLEGEFDVYAGAQGFNVKQGECVFLPRLIPHAFRIRSPRLRLLLVITPGGLEASFRSMASPAERMELPTGMKTYATADLARVVEVLTQYGVRLLQPEEIAVQLPMYPNPL